ncbi:drug/metabolite exporter family transporter [Canicola haemoglobinophilus]|uniref:Drug/metabolite exporter family transporter n=1 Tax=Canicola haemoglobinophilus TaxID=733 RepID=A0AB38HAT3_9PAST|nr:DMT family transporter [Canicola haemoglobinophilus]STO53863.1 drug/metabolite exporter family transporter [Canicola haemoglobinophilus]STO68396.1 drug/metabolite exporter family transporter [Canicola haemoglobinophilus]
MNKKYAMYNLSYILLLGAGLPILRYMSQHFDTNNNNMVRFLAGSAVLFSYGLWRYPAQFHQLKQSPLLLIKVLILGVLMTTNMYLFMRGLTYTSAVTGSLFSILAMPLAIGLAALFYPDERTRIKQAKFYWGSFIAILGALLFVMQRSSINAEFAYQFSLGALFLFVAIFIQGVQSLVIKSMNNQINAVVISAFVALLAGILNFAISFSADKLIELTQVSHALLIGLAGAGVYGIVTGMFMSFHVVQTQGIVTYNLLQLIVPFSTALFAYIALGETLNMWQILSGGVVILSCLYALKK